MYSVLQRQAIIEAVVRHPELTHQGIADQFGLARLTVVKICTEAGVKRIRGAGSYAYQCAIAKKVEKNP
jgi:hypothetical protein